MNKSVFSYLFVFVLLWLVGCGPAPVTPTATVEIAAASPIPTYTPTLSPSATPTMTRTRSAAATSLVLEEEVLVKPTATPRPSPTGTPTPDYLHPTPIPPIVWADGIEPLITLPTNSFAWSPVANEFVYGLCTLYLEDEPPPLPSEIYKTSMSDPATTQLLFNEFYCAAPLVNLDLSLTWTPDGQKVLFVGATLEDAAAYGVWGFDNGTIWLLDIRQPSTRILTDSEQAGFIRIPTLVDWVDNHTILTSSYASGGTMQGWLLDITSGQTSLFFSQWAQGDFRPRAITSDYIATTSGDYYASPVTTDAVPVAAAWQPSLPDMPPFVRESVSPPFPELTEEQTRHYPFQGWLPSTNTMLLLTWEDKIDTDCDYYDSELLCDLPTQLYWWDVGENELRPWLPFGLGAAISPDGLTVSVLTRGPVQLDANQYPIGELLVPADSVPTLHFVLLDRVSGKALLPAIPVKIVSEESTFFCVECQTYSPNGSHLAFFTEYPLALDNDGKPTGQFVALDAPQPHLNILDTTTRQILFSYAGNKGWPYPVWSPDGAKLAFADAQENVQVYDVASGSLTPLTQANANAVISLQWSFDGQYLAILSDNFWATDTVPQQLFILPIE